MWRRGRNGANPGMVPPRNRGSDIRSRTHGRDVLNGGSGSRSGDGGRRARVRATGRGRRRLPHFGPEAVSSAHLHHGWVREGEDGRKKGFINDME